MFRRLVNFFKEIKDKVKDKAEEILWDQFLKLPPQEKSKIIKDRMNKNPKINRIAEILELKLEKGSVELKAKLKGETESLELSVNYTLKENTICITNVETNKEWLNALKDIFKEKYSEIDINVFGKHKNKVKSFINSLF